MKTYANALLIIAAATSLAGCAAVWGHGYHVDSQNSSSITINSDPSIDNTGDLQNIAQAHCAQYGKDAIPQASQMSPWGLRDVTFDCVARHP